MIFWEIRLIFMGISHGFVCFFATLIHNPDPDGQKLYGPGF